MDQRKMPLMGEAYNPALRQVTQTEIEQCDSVQDALVVCRQNAPYRRDWKIAELIEMGNTQFSRCLRGTMNFPPKDLEVLEDKCQNMAITQYLCWRRGILIPESSGERELREAREQEDEARRKREELEARYAAA